MQNEATFVFALIGAAQEVVPAYGRMWTAATNVVAVAFAGWQGMLFGPCLDIYTIVNWSGQSVTWFLLN